MMQMFRHRILPRTLFGRSLLILALPILLLQIIVAFVFFDRHWESMNSKLVFSLAGEIHMLSEKLSAADSQSELDDIVGQAAKSLEILIILEDRDTPLKASEERLPFETIYWFSTSEKLRNMLGQKLTMPFSVLPYEKERWFEIRVEIKPGKIARFLCHDRRLTSSTTYIFILWLIGSAVILLAISLLFMRNQIRPIMRLAVAAEKLGKGQDVPDFKPVGATEVRKAAQAFLDMKERLKRQIEQRTAMLAGVSHDLRTPLTRLRLQIAMLKNSTEADNMRQDIEEMEKMIEGYLAFARGESGEVTETVDLRPVLDRIVGNARRQGFVVHDQLAERMFIKVRPVAIERALGNVVTNACKFAKNIWVSAYLHDKDVEICVDDDGPGISQELREDVFKPFYRVEKSRNKKTGGIGLGLSIAQDVVHSHGGEIFLEDSNRGGLRVVIRLPL